MALRQEENVGSYLKEYTKYFRSYFSSSFQGNQQGRQYSARKVRDLDRLAREKLGAENLAYFVSQREAFRRDYFERFRDWIMVSLVVESEAGPSSESIRL